MTNTFTAYHIDCSTDDSDILLALLADDGFDSFQETDSGLIAYAVSDRHQHWVEVLDDLKQRISFTYRAEEMEVKNWNEVWESAFTPIRIDDRLSLRAHFHPPVDGVAHDLVIDPKMSFGTGHHATTHMMCELLFEHFAEDPKEGQRFLDYGCGTGVLAILAKRLGASEVDAVDIEPWAIENTEENAAANDVALKRLVVGTLDEIISGTPYDVVLANINRNVLLASAEALRDNIRVGGRVYLSGILLQDEKRVVEHYGQTGFQHLRTVAREDWRAAVFIRE
ncbi:50S ribosomal protein L11 methyltransferase [Lewinella sp. IMCC34191]|uniref:50S ribosomal protein L11 methyltransferase n=1 Tax=Lewinella sp. IMCC34191 TaxID=2259172 RepID=UPI00130031D5|nr:50S ribosomal protein L11 methyltransferase [Lewinella sp. IMCC34191]